MRKPLSQIPSDAILSPLVIEQSVCLYIPEDLVSIHRDISLLREKGSKQPFGKLKMLARTWL